MHHTHTQVDCVLAAAGPSSERLAAQLAASQGVHPHPERPASEQGGGSQGPGISPLEDVQVMRPPCKAACFGAGVSQLAREVAWLPVMGLGRLSLHAFPGRWERVSRCLSGLDACGQGGAPQGAHAALVPRVGHGGAAALCVAGTPNQKPCHHGAQQRMGRQTPLPTPLPRSTCAGAQPRRRRAAAAATERPTPDSGTFWVACKQPMQPTHATHAGRIVPDQPSRLLRAGVQRSRRVGARGGCGHGGRGGARRGGGGQRGRCAPADCGPGPWAGQRPSVQVRSGRLGRSFCLFPGTLQQDAASSTGKQGAIGVPRGVQALFLPLRRTSAAFFGCFHKRQLLGAEDLAAPRCSGARAFCTSSLPVLSRAGCSARGITQAGAHLLSWDCSPPLDPCFGRCFPGSCSVLDITTTEPKPFTVANCINLGAAGR